MPSRLLVADSDAMRGVVAAIERAAQSDAPVLITGEVGTGRALVGRVIHLASARRDAPIEYVEAGAVPAEILAGALERETGDALSRAAGGTLLVKELCELPKRVQRRLASFLRAPSARRAAHSVRICATGDQDLARAAEAGVLNEVLYERISSQVIQVPALRDRTEDLPALAGAVIKRYARQLGRGRIAVSSRAYERLRCYPFPGNVAELKIICRRLVVRCQHGQISSSDVERAIPVIAERVPVESLSLEELVRSKLSSFLRRLDGHALTGLYSEVLCRLEKPLLDVVLEHTGGNQVRAAEILGLNRNTLRRKLAEHGLRARARPSDRRRRTTPEAG